ncbi:MAG: hypothetical protein EOS58_06315 [Mesorhizobium sp.]|uniref:hypothetical protein n=1 Tax=Mesorhizobium sp. M4A.F.Ca.ET.022.05.2.1 TaxID=2496653 RepID=UPI000FCBA7C1|nr:hypothetical protein [Mesorhizobium sp. M4A.F.Ca.ET.022.05.2.1]RVC75827.1 hypothetical protein EN745_26435 [Mesorhizobium sp. M4A.F.Ca.ET.022.05.2.1]RWD06619.1 MAG: hypothetical protein EOS58_06315 [Mesorhizobium sp.]
MTAITELFQRITVEDATRDRVAAIVNGWAITRNVDKRLKQKGWPTAVVDVATVTTDKAWVRSTTSLSTGVRIENGLAVIDMDIDDPIVEEKILPALRAAFPALKLALWRHGKGYKIAIFVRTDEEFPRISGLAWLKPGTTTDDGAHRVEMFGGGSPRQFGAIGYHTAPKPGVAPVFYVWEGDRSPVNTNVHDLPTLIKQDFFLIADIVDRVLEAAGWTVVEKSTRGEIAVRRKYDLVETMKFNCIDGVTRTLAELPGAAAAWEAGGQPLRCSAASWLEGPEAMNLTRCLVRVTPRGEVFVWDTAKSVSHYPMSAAPVAADLGALAEKLRELTGGEEQIDVIDLLAEAIAEIALENIEVKVGGHERA